ncbi:MAG TPA: DUF4129 domain-containing protein [Chthonomonadales bacterium]|nr:DUF4129 domain-containing protein [Chthonomonadales bacterium]
MKRPGRSGAGSRNRACRVLIVMCAHVAVLTACAFARCQGVSTPDAARIHSEVRSILSGAEYRSESRQLSSLDTALHWLGKQWDALRHWLDRLFSGFGSRMGQLVGAGAFGLQWLFLGGFLAAGLWIVHRLLRQYQKMRADESYAEPGPSPPSPERPEEFENRDPDWWLTEAERKAKAGDYAAALRAAYAALLCRLYRDGLIRTLRGRTNGEVLDEISAAGSGAASDVMADATEVFNRRVYGGEATGRSDYEKLRGDYLTLAAKSAGPSEQQTQERTA